jgi:hypothetical protein
VIGPQPCNHARKNKKIEARSNASRLPPANLSMFHILTSKVVPHCPSGVMRGIKYTSKEFQKKSSTSELDEAVAKFTNQTHHGFTETRLCVLRAYLEKYTKPPNMTTRMRMSPIAESLTLPLTPVSYYLDLERMATTTGSTTIPAASRFDLPRDG